MTAGGLQAAFLAERPRLLRLLRARLGNTEEAEEAVQDLWFRVETLDARPIADATAYLLRMANNLATDRRISATRRGQLETHWHDVQPGPVEHPDVERALLARDQLAQAQSVIAAMPERMRTAYMMFRIEELPQRIIATRMGISVSAVEKLLKRAYTRFHQLGEESDAHD